ncbi:ERF family protein [Bradyrhizobium sp. WYCCWR 12699]|uniref:ERF family protein n=1 Tax=Bradyrhizobium sp. WYCCWR 12699 TaxID=3064203 RepID=UPI0028A2F0FA|nr:ERF family protein [Bradyrhizobium sp. WYCCWR 12699]MDT4743669.1 ERF family protein [Bradyrhizobium sp. WYCCWR 12699]
MQRSSPNIGALAAALAKAQTKLQNPPKSLTATIETPFPRVSQRSFRYAPLCAGLDIARKCLGEHEIAVVQATNFDRDTGLIHLTTTLVHASGEWIASEWPVCPAIDTAAPHRMGAALTYARRYALFTLVGIAGEDDIDAPDLAITVGAPSQANAPVAASNGLDGEASDAAPRARPLLRPPADLRQRSRSQTGPLGADESARRRDRLVSEIESFTDSAELDAWSLHAWREVNALASTDGARVRQAFSARLGAGEEVEHGPQPASPPTSQDAPADPGDGGLALPKLKRQRDRQHLRFVAKQPCLVCGRQPCDPHHVRFAQAHGLGQKVSDEYAVPLCRAHHRELHRAGRETEWWSTLGIEPLPAARTLWLATRPSAGA